MSIFEHHDKHNEKHDDPKPAEPQESHAAQANQPPEQHARPQPRAAGDLTVTDPEVLRNRFFLLWGA